MSRCKSCGADIIWIKTNNGKSMPCDPDQVLYKQKKGGAATTVTPNGEVVKCELNVDPEDATGIGYIPHWATCSNADQHRKKRNGGTQRV